MKRMCLGKCSVHQVALKCFSGFRVPAVLEHQSLWATGQRAFKRIQGTFTCFNSSLLCCVSSPVLSFRCPEVPAWVTHPSVMKLPSSLLFSSALSPHLPKSPPVLQSLEVQQVYPNSVQLTFAVDHFFILLCMSGPLHFCL